MEAPNAAWHVLTGSSVLWDFIVKGDLRCRSCSGEEGRRWAGQIKRQTAKGERKAGNELAWVRE